MGNLDRRSDVIAIPGSRVGVECLIQRVELCTSVCWERFCLQFPNAVVLNAVVRRNTQKSSNDRKRAQTQVRKRTQKGGKGRKSASLRKNCKQPGLKQPGLKQPGLGTPKRTIHLVNQLRNLRQCQDKLPDGTASEGTS